MGLVQIFKKKIVSKIQSQLGYDGQTVNVTDKQKFNLSSLILSEGF